MQKVRAEGKQIEFSLGAGKKCDDLRLDMYADVDENDDNIEDEINDNGSVESYALVDQGSDVNEKLRGNENEGSAIFSNDSYHSLDDYGLSDNETMSSLDDGTNSQNSTTTESSTGNVCVNCCHNGVEGLR